ncbi:MAG: hypothetical protein U0Q11_05440 [Vicinamibacterales bacterium]
MKIAGFTITVGSFVLLATCAGVLSNERTALAQAQSSSVVPFTAPIGKCLPAEQKKVNDTYYSLTRPTRDTDDMPFWDPEYLAGTWDVDLRSQDSPFGPGGQSVGTLTIKVTDSNPCVYEGTLNAEDPEGKKFTRTITANYEPAAKTLTMTEKDSRGFTITRKGPIGGELGGLFHHHFGDDPAAQPATDFGGHKYAFKGVTEMSSPAYFKTELSFSTDGGPYKTFGRMLFEKQLPGK